MVSRYLRSTERRPARPQAARKLIGVYGAAVETISRDPPAWFPHPRPYPELAACEFRWIKIHRYWIGYIPGPDPIMTNILDEVSDIEATVSLDRNPADIA
jgi:hypothetical protein